MAGFFAALAPLVVVLGTPGLTASAVPAKHGAHDATLTLRATFELQCRHAGNLSVGLPGAMRVGKIGASTVTVQGAQPASVRISQHVVQITMPPSHGMTCDSISPVRITVHFASGAGLVNPARAGTYAIWLRAGAQTATGRLRIS